MVGRRDGGEATSHPYWDSNLQPLSPECPHLSHATCSDCNHFWTTTQIHNSNWPLIWFFSALNLCSASRRYTTGGMTLKLLWEISRDVSPVICRSSSGRLLKWLLLRWSSANWKEKRGLAWWECMELLHRKCINFETNLNVLKWLFH